MPLSDADHRAPTSCCRILVLPDPGAAGASCWASCCRILVLPDHGVPSSYDR